MSSLKELHPGNSLVQQNAEKNILLNLQEQQSLFSNNFSNSLFHQLKQSNLHLDGVFLDSKEKVCLIEIWAHQGKAKTSQQHKVMNDICKLALAETIIKRSCRKIFAVTNSEAISFLKNSWKGKFQEMIGIEMAIIPINTDLRFQILETQKKQFR